MKPLPHPLCNTVLRRPESSSEDECGDLPVLRKGGVTYSFWQPSREEIRDIAAGQPVILGCAGDTHPPVFLCTLTPDHLTAG